MIRDLLRLRIRFSFPRLMPSLRACALVGLCVSAAFAAKKKVMPAGDSITNGVGSTLGGGYRLEVWNRVIAAGKEIDFVGGLADGPTTFDRDHCGINGGHVGHLHDKIAGWMGATAPDIILLEIGTNDINTGSNASGTADALQSLLNDIYKISPAVTVFVASITPLGDAQKEKIVQDYNARVKAIAEASASQGKKTFFVDIHSTIGAGDSDGLHPHDSGYKKMGEMWYNAIAPLLGGGSTALPFASRPTHKGPGQRTVSLLLRDSDEPFERLPLLLGRRIMIP